MYVLGNRAGETEMFVPTSGKPAGHMPAGESTVERLRKSDAVR
jgi:hypothetical protein